MAKTYQWSGIYTLWSSIFTGCILVLWNLLLTVMRINASSWGPKIIRSFTVFTVLHNNFVYRSIDVTQAVTQRTSGLKRKLTEKVEKNMLYTNRSRTHPCALAKTVLPKN